MSDPSAPVHYEEAPAPTCRLKRRCEWRSATGHRCELEPHSEAVPHRCVLDDGGLLVTSGRASEGASGNIAALEAQLEARWNRALATPKHIPPPPTPMPGPGRRQNSIG
jgi:hypothetical protein